MRGKACSVEFMRRLDKLVQAGNGRPHKELVKFLVRQTCLGQSQINDLLRVLELENELSGYPEKPQPTILVECLGAPYPVALATQAIEEGWTAAKVRQEPRP